MPRNTYTRARQASSNAYPEHSSSLQWLTAPAFPEPDTPSRHSASQSGPLTRADLWICMSRGPCGKAPQGFAMWGTPSPWLHARAAVAQQHPQTLLLLCRTSLPATQRPNPRGHRQVLYVALFIYLRYSPSLNITVWSQNSTGLERPVSRVRIVCWRTGLTSERAFTIAR